MAGNSFTWSLTSGTGSFTTAANWVEVPSGATAPNFSNGSDDFSILTGDTVTGLNGVTIDSLTINDPGVTVIAGAAQNTFITGLTLDAGGVLDANQGGALVVGKGGVATGAIVINGTLNAGGAAFDNNLAVNGGAATPADLSGSGTIVANGYLQIASGITIGGATTLTFDITDNGNNTTAYTTGDATPNTSILEFDNNVNSGAIDFLGSTGYLVLTGTQVGVGTKLVNGGTFGASVAGLTVGAGQTNAIEIATDSYTGPASMTAALSGTDNDILTLTDGSGDNYVINLVGDYTGASVQVVADDSSTIGGSGLGGFDVFLVCYGAGTAILTDRGEVAVETIQAGDTVITLVEGAPVSQTVKWVGSRDLDLTRHPKPDAVAPIRISRGALGDNLPHRDLYLSPDHSLFIDGRLYPAKLLVNDMTIVRDLAAKSVSYHHVELEKHAVMVAEGVPAESYLDTGNRAFFSNAGLATVLHPEMNINESLRCWETDACAPLTAKPELVKPVWQRFADRAVALGHTAPVYETTEDAGIHLLVDGKVVRPLAAGGKTISFMVPGEARSVRLVSRATRPSALTPWLDDPRTLGVAIRSVTLRDPAGESVLNADHPALSEGWHAPEYTADGSFWRWSVGNAVLPFVTSGPCTVEITLSETTTYIERASLAA